MKKNAYEEMYVVEDKHWWYVVLHELVLLFSKYNFSHQSLDILDAGCGTGGLLSVYGAILVGLFLVFLGAFP